MAYAMIVEDFVQKFEQNATYIRVSIDTFYPLKIEDYMISKFSRLWIV